MTLPSIAFAVLALTTPDVCAQANEMAQTIQRARNARVSIITVLIVLEQSDLYQQMAVISYANPPIPPAAFGATVEGVCRDALRD